MKEKRKIQILACKMIAQGMTKKEIAGVLKCTYTQVCFWIREIRIERKCKSSAQLVYQLAKEKLI